MTTFSASDAALVGFRIARERPMVVLAWAVVMFVVSIVSAVLIITTAGSAFTEITQASATPGQTDPQVMLGLLQKLAPAFLVLLPLSLLYSGVVNAAGYRLVLQPGERGFGAFKLGGDEIRQVLVSILVVLIVLAAYVGVILAVAGLAAVGSLVHPAVGGLLAVLAVIAGLCAVIWLAVRLSLSGATTFAHGKVDIRSAWDMSKGRFWPIFGTYVLAVVLLLLVQILGYAITAGFALALGGLQGVGAISSPDYSSLGTHFTPTMIITYVLQAFFTALTSLIIICPAAVIYRQLTPQTDVFD